MALVVCFVKKRLITDWQSCKALSACILPSKVCNLQELNSIERHYQDTGDLRTDLRTQTPTPETPLGSPGLSDRMVRAPITIT